MASGRALCIVPGVNFSEPTRMLVPIPGPTTPLTPTLARDAIAASAAAAARTGGGGNLKFNGAVRFLCDSLLLLPATTEVVVVSLL